MLTSSPGLSRRGSRVRAPSTPPKTLMKTATCEWLFSFLFQTFEYEQNLAGIPSGQGRPKAIGIYGVARTGGRARPGRAEEGARWSSLPARGLELASTRTTAFGTANHISDGRMSIPAIRGSQFMASKQTSLCATAPQPSVCRLETFFAHLAGNPRSTVENCRSWSNQLICAYQ
jgi:hypothetical protein